jgi:hypothetical protein
MTVHDVASTHCASIFFRIETSFPSDNIMKKFKPPERQLSHGKLEDEEMDLGQVPVCHQCFHQCFFHLAFPCLPMVWIHPNFN